MAGDGPFRILFLGAGKRLSLLEAFAAAAAADGLELECHAVEAEPRVPIAGAAAIHIGPAFLGPDFAPYLVELAGRLRPRLVIPNMDSATVALARLAGDLEELGCRAVVSSLELCQAMYDKILADDWFRARGIPVPGASGWPRIAKHRLGFGSRDQAVLAGPEQAAAFFRNRDRSDYLVQSFVEGREYTIDAYLARDGRVLGTLSRRRLAVLGGEVDVSLSERNEAVLDLCRQVLACPGWQGPITLQAIQGPQGLHLIEINPRFGGGVTHAFHCGLPMPAWLLREARGLPVEPVRDWLEGSLMTRCRRDIFHDPQAAPPARESLPEAPRGA
jgi:carbamoyl-phosphate synthase large subunit